MVDMPQKDWSDYACPTGPDTRQPDEHRWQRVENAPSDGRRVFIWGGYTEQDGHKEYFPVDVATADGGWWRVAGLKSTPTHWQPAVWPAPPESET